MQAVDAARELFQRGGPVMWPLLALSLLSLTLTIERAAFWAKLHAPGTRRYLAEATKSLRAGNRSTTTSLAKSNHTLYAQIIAALNDRPPTPASAVELSETVRPNIERFAAIQAVIITAAPLLGILGTVLGIIESFDVLAAEETVRDVNAVAAGIAEALITTAFGLIVALLTLFPHALFRANANRCLGSIERLAAAALQSRYKKKTKSKPAPSAPTPAT